jgi:hypothetical protein
MQNEKDDVAALIANSRVNVPAWSAGVVPWQLVGVAPKSRRLP